MKVLEIEPFGRGGLLHYAHNLAAALAGRGHEATLLTSVGFELDGQPASAGGVRVVKAFGRVSKRLPQSAPGVLRKLVLKAEAAFDALSAAVTARRLRPDVVHFHSTNTSALLYLLCLKTARRPIVVTAHVVTPHEPVRFQTTIYRLMHVLGDLTIAHSEFDRERLIREFALPAEKIVVIPHGEYGFFERDARVPEREEARRRLGIGASGEVALFFGYIREYKGLDLLLDAWPRVAEARPAARLVAAGDPVQLPAARRGELEKQADGVGAVHHFRYIPFEEVPVYFAAADVLVMPYRHISQSGVLFLALSLGVPVVATKVGGLTELLEHRRTAFLVPPESADDLANGIAEVLGDDALRARLSASGRSLAREHSWEAIADRTAKAFEPLLG